MNLSLQTPQAYVYSFGAFRLYPGRQMLLYNDTPVAIGGRALDILTALVNNAGELLDKNLLIKMAWPDTVVEECNLRSQIASLRRILSIEPSGFYSVASVKGRGYRFVATVSHKLLTHESPAKAHEPLQGRDADLQQLRGLLGEHRLVTLTGPGGIGKTALARWFIEGLQDRYDGPTLWVDVIQASRTLTPLELLCNVLDIPDGQQRLATVIDRLRDQHLLLTFDGCEPQINAVSELVFQILQQTEYVDILATSREPLGIGSENVHRLRPLSFPDARQAVSTAQALCFPAIRLFVDRIRLQQPEFHFGDVSVACLVELCRKLDGLPLAIEIVASHAQALGVQGLNSVIDAASHLQLPGCRIAPVRQQSLASDLDWSLQGLSPTERGLLTRLSLFDPPFTLEDLFQMATWMGIDTHQVPLLIGSLVRKSLVIVEHGSADHRYRLYATLRTYALETLKSCGDFDSLSARHATYLLEKNLAEKNNITGLYLVETKH